MSDDPQQFLVVALDGTDADSVQRHLSARPAHVALCDELAEKRNHLYGASLLDDNGKIIGSCLYVQFADRDELDRWLTVEPYVTGNVWQDINVRRARRHPQPFPPLNNPDAPRFLIVGSDGNDDQALERRLAVRSAHIAHGDELSSHDQLLFRSALLNDQEQMNGSALFVDFPSRAELDNWLTEEPYVTGDVWRKTDIWQCRIGPTFVRMHPSQ